MKTAGKMMMAAMAVTAAMAASNSRADEIGWLDSVEAGQVDNAIGWVCMNEDAYNTPMYGSLDVYLYAPADQGGTYYGNYQLAQGTWGFTKDGVNQAGYCGTDTYVGFKLIGWFVNYEETAPTKVYVYWRNNFDALTMLGGSPITITNIGSNISSAE